MLFWRCSVTVIVSVPEFPAPSVAVTVIMLSPLDRLMLEIVQLVVPLAVPLPPLLLLHVTQLTLPELSDAVPLKVMASLVVVYVELDVGLVMVTVGAVVSPVEGVGVGVGVDVGVGVGVAVALYVTVIASVPEFLVPSFAVTVITLSPLDRLMLEIVQLVRPACRSTSRLYYYSM